MERIGRAGLGLSRGPSSKINQAESGRDRQGLRPVYRTQFLHDVVYMEIDRSLADTQDNRDVPGAFPLFQPVENFFFPGGKNNFIYIRLPAAEDMGEGEVKVGNNHSQNGLGASVMFHC
jgi:hypothetical protein